jgi:hypothetical protein
LSYTSSPKFFFDTVKQRALLTSEKNEVSLLFQIQQRGEKVEFSVLRR